MTAKLQSDILALLSDPDLHQAESELVDENTTDADPDISDVLLESIKKAQETNEFESTPEDNAFADSCLAFYSDNNWESMKTALLDALNTPNSGLHQSSDSDLDEEMGTARDGDGETAEEEEVESREGIFEIWNLDIKESSDEELGLVKDLKEVLRIYSDTCTGTSTDAGTSEEERLNSELGGQTTNVEELVADMGNLSLDPVEGWKDNILN